MIKYSITIASAVALGAALGPAAPAWAGGIGDFLSPAFGTACANLHTGARAAGTTTHGTGAANGNLAGLPLGSPLNQCGGADPLPNLASEHCVNNQQVSSGPAVIPINVPVNALQCTDLGLGVLGLGAA
ncbi:chaplin family protein [Streptomyces rubradiris]|uniref:chaplin family protein n=1 Tax=Streptomyces rubradiris TaxID=285531 RepID=UPI0033E9164C